MELTHKLKIPIGSHTEHRIIFGQEYQFEYEEYPGSASHETYPLILKDHPYTADMYSVVNPPYGSDTTYYNISKPLTLPEGKYKAIVGNEGASMTLMRLYAYESGSSGYIVGEYSNGEFFEIDTEGVYVLMDARGEFDDLQYKVVIVESEYDEEVKDYDSIVIDEPIGFDDLQSTIKRHDYHGMGAEVSLGNLEFYGAAIGIIETAYAADIDSEVVYEVLAGQDVMYRGQLDLSTLHVKQGDYKSVHVKVGEIGAKTTFNNRTDKEIDVDDPKTIDGNAVTDPIWKSLHIPMKHLPYTNQAKQKTDKEIPQSGTFRIGQERRFLVLPFGDDIINEFGTFDDSGVAYCVTSSSSVDPQYYADSEHTQKYGSETIAHIEAGIHAIIKLDRVPGGSFSFTYQLKAVDGDGNVLSGSAGMFMDGTKTEIPIHCTLTGDMSVAGSIKFYIQIQALTGTVAVGFDVSVVVKKGNYLKMTMFDTLVDDDKDTQMIMVYDALNVVSRAISENALDVKSDWYEYANTPGGGALKALTNGYKIRGLFTDGETKRNMPLSFKALIESLSALDNIGWGFSTENGNTCVRVERWDWFYNDTPIIAPLKNVAEITREVLTDRIPTELKIGYKKYATQDQYNSIDSPHGTRSFINGIKALSQAVTKECEFIADNYAIEETRRARTQVNETEESTYDENIFVFELVEFDGGTPFFQIHHTALNAQKVGKVDEFINAKLTPRHMAARWADYLFATNNTTPFRFTTGEINYQAVFAVIPEFSTDGMLDVYSLRPFVADPSVAQAENADIAHTAAKFKAEKITFSYPITVAQYKAILANPYGTIQLTDDDDNIIAEGWITDFKYKFEDGLADFTLIAKNTITE